MRKLKNIMKMVLFLVVLALIGIKKLNAQSYSLEHLSSEPGCRASVGIQKFMLQLELEKLNECLGDLKGVEKNNSYFLAIKIVIYRTRYEHYLVFPSDYCPSFFGAHAIAYWIVSKSKTNRFRLLYAGQSDGITILQEETHGYRNIKSYYGNSDILLKFNKDKKVYLRADGCER